MSTRALSYALGAVVVGGTSYYLLRKYVAGGVCRSRASLKGRTVIITGANAGVGLETAADLAGRGARVIMACRSVERGEKAAVEVRKRSGNNNVVFSQLDLASLASVRQFAERTLKEPQIDVLINNAGVCLPEVSLTVDGNEIHFAVNHLGHFLLTNLLLDRIKESTASRIVVVSSRMQGYSEPFDFETVNTDNNTMLYSGMLTRAYAQSKLANALFSYSLSKRLEGTGVTVNALHPGAIDTEMASGSLFRTLPFLHYFKVLKRALSLSLSLVNFCTIAILTTLAHLFTPYNYYTATSSTDIISVLQDSKGGSSDYHLLCCI